MPPDRSTGTGVFCTSLQATSVGLPALGIAESALVATPPDRHEDSAGWIYLSLGVAGKDRVRDRDFLRRETVRIGQWL
jgi:hypothetical protein